MSKHKIDIDEVCSILASGYTYTEAARILHVPTTTLYAYTARTPEYLEKTQLALQVSADAYMVKAFDCLNALHSGSTIGDIAKAKNLAGLFKFMAIRRNPAVFNERVSLLLAGGEVKSKRKTIVVEIQQDDDPAVKSNVKALPPETVPYIDVTNTVNAQKIKKENESKTQEFTGANED